MELDIDRQKFAMANQYYNAGDYNNAVPIFLELAQKGYAEAQSSIGTCYYNGQGVKQNYYDAALWFRRAADQGHPDAQYNVGFCYYNGHGEAKDAEKAEEWFNKAAAQGNAAAKAGLEFINKQKIVKKKAQFTGELCVLCGGLMGFLVLWIAKGIVPSLSGKLLISGIVLGAVALIGFFLFYFAWTKKRIFSVVLLSLICAGSLYIHRTDIFFPEIKIPLPFIGEILRQKEVKKGTATGNVNLRAEPSGSSDVLKFIYKDSVIIITGEASGGWLPVEYDGQKGWVGASYIRVHE